VALRSVGPGRGGDVAVMDCVWARCEWAGTDANGQEWAGMDANRRDGVQMGGNGHESAGTAANGWERAVTWQSLCLSSSVGGHDVASKVSG